MLRLRFRHSVAERKSAMATIRDVASITVAGMPKGADEVTDGWLVYSRIRGSITDRNRKAGGAAAFPSLEADGHAGWLWRGHLTAVKRYMWQPGQPAGHPYVVAYNASPEQKEAAEANFRPAHAHLTTRTANMICLRQAPGSETVWWVRDTWTDEQLASREAYDELKAKAVSAANAAGHLDAPVTAVTSAPEPAAPGLADPADMFDNTHPPAGALTDPAAQELLSAASAAVTHIPQDGGGESGYRSRTHSDTPLSCRYLLATGCTATYNDYTSLHYHEELGDAHKTAPVPITTCPVCGAEKGKNRARHLALGHGILSGSAERITLDGEQTLRLWQDLYRRPAPARQAPTAKGKIDLDALARDAIGRHRGVAAASPAATPPAAFEAPPAAPEAPQPAPVPAAAGPDADHAAVAAIRALLEDYDRRGAELGRLRAREERVAKARQALNDLAGDL
jgi:hypothetical protein